MAKRTDIPGVRFVECDADLKRHIGRVMGKESERHIHLGDGFCIVALQGERPVGIVSAFLQCLPGPLAETYEGYVDIIEIVPECRRKGIGRRLVELTIDRCCAEGLYQVRAWSSEDKVEAIALWKALGFGLCPATVQAGGQSVKGYFATARL